jgi:carbon storage regulator
MSESINEPLAFLCVAIACCRLAATLSRSGVQQSPSPAFTTQRRDAGMLVLSRKKDERIIVGDRLLTFTIVAIRGDKVRIGIQAEPELSVHREEVFDAIEREQLATKGRESDAQESA